MSKKKSLVTGGAGFIGSHLVEKLLKIDHEVLVIDNLSTGKINNIDQIERIHFIEGEVGDDESLSKVFKFNPDYCFHLAAQSSVTVSVENPSLDQDCNINQPLRLINSIKETQCRRFFFSSSGGTIFGVPKMIPTKENDFGSEPVSPYGNSKKKLNEYIVDNFQGSDINFSILNFANVYGPRQDPHGEAGVISIFAKRFVDGINPIVYGTGKQTRDFIYVGDVIEALYKCMFSEENHILNIGSGVETSVLELVSTIEASLNSESKIIFKPAREGELLRSVLDCSLAKELINWEAKTSLEQGITEVINWVKN